MGDRLSESDLPAVAWFRMERIKRAGAWDSRLSTEELAAIRSAGFEPVGQVVGAAVYDVARPPYSTCYGALADGGYGAFGEVRAQVTGKGRAGWLGSLVSGAYLARRTAVSRMAAECAALGGHGVVGVSLEIGPFPDGGLGCTAVGTAVRSPGTPALGEPFTSDLSGQDFAKLITGGWTPVGLALGISIGSRHNDGTARAQRALRAGNAEITAYTQLLNAARADARAELRADVTRMGAEGVVVAVNDVCQRVGKCPTTPGGTDHIAEVTMMGTAIARFASRAAAPPASLAILPLDPRRRHAPGVRIGLRSSAPEPRSLFEGYRSPEYIYPAANNGGPAAGNAW